jgi:hypothetical protein
MMKSWPMTMLGLGFRVCVRTVSVTSLPKKWLLEEGSAMPAMKLNASGGAKRHMSMALASSEKGGV